MKFSDIIVAVASLAVVLLFIEVILGLLIPAIGWDWGPVVIGTICYLLSGLVVGVVFSRKIWEEKAIKAMAKIIVLGATLLILYYAAAIPSQGDWTALVKENYQSANPGATLTTSQWWSVEVAALGQVIALNVIIGIVAAFIGLYIGSVLRKPGKS